ncbi:MAG: hypothetical protein HYY85_06810, partial [Deltaproteobacteria bacterium]|nr:hypothetical protein [Deltaproteobacteria bacterium]
MLPAILLITVAAYLNTFPNPFVWDDRSLILGNERIRAWRNLGAIFSHTIPLGPLFGGTPSQAYRPLYELALAVDYALWGTTPLGFHLTNVLLHLANVVLLLRLLCGFVPPWPAACTVGLWAVHPILTEAITLVSARNHLLFALFVLAGLLLWRRGCATDTRHPWRWLIAGGACMTAGLLSHELAISFPLLALLVHAAGGPERPLGVRGALAARAPAYAGLLLVAGAYLGLRLTVLPLGGPLRPGALLENLGPRLLFLPQLFTTYLGFILVPLHLSLDHGSAVRFPTSVLEPGVLGTGLFLVVLGTAAWRVRHRTWLPLLGLLWFAIALLPVSNLLPFYAVIGERYLYLPAAG